MFIFTYAIGLPDSQEMNSRTLWKRVCTIASWTLISRVLGLIRDRLMGAFFGASLILDAFYVAFALPNMMRNLFGEGALSSAFIPRYSQLREQDPEQAEAFAGLVLTHLAVFLSGLAAIGMLVCASLMLWSEQSKIILVAVLAFAQLPYLVFICVSAIMAGVLNTRKHFAIPAAAPIILNVCMIGTVVFWHDVYLLPYAIFCTGVLQLFMHALALRFIGGVPACTWKSTESFSDMKKALLPTIIAASVFQVNAFLDAIIAYKFLDDATGAVVILYFANRLLQFPLALIAHGVGTAAYPEMSRVALQGYTATGLLLRNVNRLLMALVMPAAVGLYLVAEPLTRCIYQAGAFGDESVMRVVAVTHIYAFGLIPIALSKILVRSFHAHRNQKTPMYIAIMGVLVNLSLNIVLVIYTDLDERGLALASVVSSFLMCALYVGILVRKGTGIIFDGLALLSVCAVTFCMGLIVWLTQHYWVLDAQASSGLRFIHLMACVLTGCVFYAVLLYRSVKRWRTEIELKQ